MKKTILIFALCLLPVFWHFGHSGNISNGNADVWKKVEIDLGQIDAAGLRGPADGKVAVAYEFSIPDTESARQQVTTIDKTVQFMPGSRGRIGAQPGECLCIGSTHQPEYRQVLFQLASLPFIRRIIVCDFE